MKKMIGVFLTIMLIAFISVTFAATPLFCKITVKNNTSETIKIESSISPDLSWKITINGSTDTPIVTLDPHQNKLLVINNNEYTGDPIVGNLWLAIENSNMGQIPQAIFSLTLANWGVGLNDNTQSYSNRDFAVSAIWLDSSDGVVDINPVTTRKS